MKKILIWTVSIIVLLLLLLIFTPLGLLLVMSAGGRELNYEIPQNVGGALIVDGDGWMDVQSFGDISKVSYKPAGSEIAYAIGDSDYYGRQFDKTKQIVSKDDNYLLSVGGRLLGDKLYASKDLETWQSFTFSTESILNQETDDGHSYLSNHYPDKIFISEDMNSADWIRRVGVKADRQARKVTFTFSLDWDTNEIICVDIIEVIADYEF